MQKFSGYRADSGKVYPTAAEALKDDLIIYLTEASGNEAIAEKITAHIVSTDFEPLYTILTDMRSEIPRAAPQLPLADPPKRVYLTADVNTHAARIRCTGINCHHPYGMCSADPIYQIYLRAEALYERATRYQDALHWNGLHETVRDEWMRKAQEPNSITKDDVHRIGTAIKLAERDGTL